MKNTNFIHTAALIPVKWKVEDIDDNLIKISGSKKKRGNPRPISLPKYIHLNQKLISGIAYYVGDGRTKTDRGLSIVDVDNAIINFFVTWLQECFKVDKYRIKIKDYSRYKEVITNSVILKEVYDKIYPVIKRVCIKNRIFASAYLRGIMAAEGSVKYHQNSGHRAIHLKMNNKPEIEYIHNLLRYLKIQSSILFSKSDGEWLISISGLSELKKLEKIKLFTFAENKKEKFKQILSSYKREQTKVGQVNYYYLSKLKKFGKSSAPRLANFIGRDRTRTIKVLRDLQKEGLIIGERIKTKGRPFVFEINKNGEQLLNDFSKRFQLTSIPNFEQDIS